MVARDSSFENHALGFGVVFDDKSLQPWYNYYLEVKWGGLSEPLEPLSPPCLWVCNVLSFHVYLHTGNGYTGSKQYPESVVSDKQFPTSPIHVTPLRDPLSKSTPLVS